MSDETKAPAAPKWTPEKRYTSTGAKFRDMKAEIAALRAEVERLREALREIAEMPLRHDTALDNQMQDIARAALEGGKP